MTKAICKNMVLIVEDDRDVREAIVEVLADAAFHPLEAANGKEAIDQLHAAPEKPCVILLDIMMPVMDGWQFRTLQRRDPEIDDIPVIVLTAHANIEQAAVELAAAACLTKPVDLGALISTINRFCDTTPATTA